MINDKRVDDYIVQQIQTSPAHMANKARDPSGRPHFERSIQAKIDSYVDDFYKADTNSVRWLIICLLYCYVAIRWCYYYIII